MLLLKGGGSPSMRTSIVGIALVAFGLVILLSGVALLLLVAAAGAALGGAVVLFRRLTGKPVVGPRRRAPSLELEADYEILPTPKDAPAEKGSDRLLG